MKNIFLGSFILILMVPLLQTQAQAQQQTQAQGDNRPFVPCADPIFRTLDFWVGDWKVYHRKSGKLAGFDRVVRILKGCAIQQSWISLDDYFSSPLIPFRMNGKSLMAFNGKQWVQFWVDNQAGSQIIKGNFHGKKLILSSPTPIMGYIYQLTWEQQKDGTVDHIARRRKVDNKNWKILFDFIYRRNINHMPVPAE